MFIFFIFYLTPSALLRTIKIIFSNAECRGFLNAVAGPSILSADVESSSHAEHHGRRGRVEVIFCVWHRAFYCVRGRQNHDDIADTRHRFFLLRV